MAQKKSNKKNKKSVADLILEHHFDDKIKKADLEDEELETVSDDVDFEPIEETSEIEEEKIVEDENDVAENDEIVPVQDEITEVEESPEIVEEQDDAKDEIKDFLKSSDEILNSVEEKNKTNSDEAVKQLQEFLNRVDKRVDKLAKAQAEKEDEIDIVGDEFQFKKLKGELTFFQNELEESIQGQFSDLSETVTSVILELKNKFI